MEQIVVQVRDKDKAKILLELLSALDFVDFVKVKTNLDFVDFVKIKTDYREADVSIEDEMPQTNPIAANADDAFFAMAGLWAGRDITIEAIRQQAWPRQSI